MAKSFVLTALRLFGLEEILKLSQIKQAKPMLMKKAAGEELIAWDDDPEENVATAAPALADKDNVLPFKSKTFKPSEMEEPLQDPKDQGEPAEDTPATFLSSDFLLWQRELTKESGSLKKDAVKGYARATEMYVVKTPLEDGKEKIRFASTHGVLVNKKQA